MKKLMAAAAIVLLAGAHSSWALVGLDNLSYDGSIEIGGYSGNNELDSSDKTEDRRGNVNSRIRVGVNADVTEDVKGRVEFVRDGGQFGAGPSNINAEESAILIQNAYLDFANLPGNIGARLGRQYVGNAGDLVWRIAPFDDDNMTTRAIDGLNVTRSWDFLSLDAFTGKAVEDDALGNTDADDPAGAGDVNVSAVHLTLPNVLPGGKIWLGWIDGIDRQGAAQGNNTLQIWRVGANGGVSNNLLTYRAEFLKNGGNDKTTSPKVKYEGSALDLGVGLNAPENGFGGIGVAADYVMASGDDNANDKDKSFHDLSEVGVIASDRYYGEIFGRSNAFALGGKPFGQGLDTGAQGKGYQIVHASVLLKPNALAKTWWKVDFYNLGADKGDDFGSEWDFTAGYRHSDNVGFEGGYALFNPKDGLFVGTPPFPDDNTTLWFGRVKVKWGGEQKS